MPGCTCRPVAYGILSVLALVFAGIGTGGPIMSGEQVSMSISLWEYCIWTAQTTGGGGSSTSITMTTICKSIDKDTFGCDALGSAVMAARAFGVMSCLICAVCIVLMIVDCIGKLPEATGKFIMAAPAGVLVLFSLICWAIELGIGNSKWCDMKESYVGGPAFQWAIAPFAMIVCTVFAMINVVIAMMVAPSGGAQPAPDQLMVGMNSSPQANYQPQQNYNNQQGGDLL